MATAIRPEAFPGATPEAVAHFKKHGWVLTQTLNPEQTAELRKWVEEISSWPMGGGDWISHKEMTATGPQICRTENFTPFHEGMKELITTGAMIEVASALLEEPAVLYKEKINYKLPGGGGWAPHQDAPAYRFVDSHVSCMVAVDTANPANGGLEVVSERFSEVLPMDAAGCIHPDVVKELIWIPVEVDAGQTLWFHSRTPHRSGFNTTTGPRRAIYPTYNALREGDLHDAYYAQKRKEWAEAQAKGDSSVQISLINDFMGSLIKA
jgi:hypothetical protein